MAHKLTNSFTA